jgi:hypothetical protein
MIELTVHPFVVVELDSIIFEPLIRIPNVKFAVDPKSVVVVSA